MAKKRREQFHQKNQRKQLQFYAMVGGAGIIVAAVIFFLFTSNQSAPIPEGVAEAYAGIEQGFTGDGFPRLGKVDAPIIVEEYSSFGCPHCKTLHDTELPRLMDEIKAGHVQVVFKPITTIGGNEAVKAARAALCAGDQGRFWEMHDIMFAWQGEYAVNSGRLEGAAEALSIDADKLKECYNSNKTAAVIRISEREFNDNGFGSTPYVVVNSVPVESNGENNWSAMGAIIADELAKLPGQ